MTRQNDSTAGHYQRVEATADCGYAAAAQDAWSREYTGNRGFQRNTRDNRDMDDELNCGLVDIYHHHDQNQNNAMHELRSGESHLNNASSELQKAIRSLNHGNSEQATRYLRESLRDINGGVEDLKDGMRLNPNDSREDRRGERTVREGIDDVKDSRQDLRRALHLLGEGKEEEAMKLLRQGRRSLNNGRDDVDSGVDEIADANRRGRRGGHGGQCDDDQDQDDDTTCEQPEEPPCHKPEPPCEGPEQPDCHEQEPHCEPKLYDKAERSLIWGDPHIQDAKGTNVEDQIEANRNLLLVKTSDGASITGHTASFNNPDLAAKEGHDITVFDKEVVNLGDGTRILMQADGKAYHVDSRGNLGEALKDNEVVTSRRDSNDRVTYDAETRTLNYSFKGDDGSTISGVLTGNIDGRGNYLNTEVKQSTGYFGGLMPALRADFTGVNVDSQTGAGAFDPTLDGRQRTNADFYIDNLFGG